MIGGVCYYNKITAIFLSKLKQRVSHWGVEQTFSLLDISRVSHWGVEQTFSLLDISRVSHWGVEQTFSLLDISRVSHWGVEQTFSLLDISRVSHWGVEQTFSLLDISRFSLITIQSIEVTHDQSIFMTTSKRINQQMKWAVCPLREALQLQTSCVRAVVIAVIDS